VVQPSPVVELCDVSEHFENAFEGVVDQQIFEGDRMLYQIRCPQLGDVVIFAFDHDPTHHKFHQKNETVGIGWNAQDLLVYERSTAHHH